MKGKARGAAARAYVDGARILGRRAFGVLLVALLVWGSFRVRSAVRANERFHLEGWEIEVGELPEWVTPEIGDEIRLACNGGSLPGSREDWNVLDAGVIRRLRGALEASPWIERLASAKLEYPVIDRPGRLALRLELRRPVALVNHGGLYYLADAQARRLGNPYREPPTEWFNVPSIVGLSSPGPLPESGQRWSSRDVGQGIEVARLLVDDGIIHDFPDTPVRAVDLSNLHGRVSPSESEIVLWCGRQRLAWGRSPISAGARTATSPEILRNLRFVLSNPDTFASYALIHLHRRQDHLTGVRG